jgi:hypothetical protein
MAEKEILVRMTVEYWKLIRALEKAVERVPEEHKSKTLAQAKFSAGRLDSFMRESGLNVVVFDGQKFEANLPATAINGDDFEGDVALFVETTIEPAIVDSAMKVVSMGKVILTRGAA